MKSFDNGKRVVILNGLMFNLLTSLFKDDGP